MMLDGFQCTNTPILASRSHCARAAYSLGVSWDGSTLPAETIQLRWKSAAVVIRNMFMFFVLSQQFNNVNPVRHFFIMPHVFSDIRESQWVPTPPSGGIGGRPAIPPFGGYAQRRLPLGYA